MTDKTTPASETVTEAELLKSLETLESKKQAEPEAAAPTAVAIEPLTKTAKDTVTEGASEALQKGLDVSPLLREITSLLGTHVDNSLKALEKSINSAANRDLSIANILESMQKSIDSLATKVEEYGKEPAAPASAREVSATTSEVLNKTVDAGTGEKKDIDPKVARKNVLIGLESLVKSCDDKVEQARLAHVTATFESAGKIQELDLKKALGEYNRLHKAA